MFLKSANGKLLGMTTPPPKKLGMTTPPPKKYADIESKLGGSLADLVATRRGEGVSWRRIALEITARTGIDIAGETVRVWSEGREPITGSAA